MEPIITALGLLILTVALPILVEAIWGDLKSGCLAVSISFLTIILLEWVLTRMGFIGYFH